jgi:hypothetical protein
MITTTVLDGVQSVDLRPTTCNIMSCASGPALFFSSHLGTCQCVIAVCAISAGTFVACAATDSSDRSHQRWARRL